MALVPHKVVALNELNEGEKNIIAGAPVSLFDTEGNAVTLFDDESGSNGSTAKQTDAEGVVVVYVTAGEYDEQVNGGIQRRVLVGNKEITTEQLIERIRKARDGDVITTTGFYSAGDGGGAQWMATSTTELSASQSPSGRLAPELVDGSGRLWELLPISATKRKAYSALALGVVGDGVQDDTNALKAGLFFGEVHGNDITCRITSRISITNGQSGLAGNMHLVGDSSYFSREDNDYNNDDGSIIYVTGDEFTMHDCRLSLDNNLNGSNTTTAVVLRGIKFDVQRCEFDTFNKSKVIRIESGREGSVFNYNYIHDCLLDSTTSGQLTGIDIDDNRVSGTPASTGIELAHNRIENMLVSAASEESFFYQSDGINISYAESNNLHIHHNTIDKVGECIDCFGQFNDIHDNYLLNAEVGGVKVINGGSYNKIHGNIIKSPRTYGVSLQGNATAGRDVIGNEVKGNTIYDVNPNSDSVLSTSGLSLEGSGASVPIGNTIEGNIFIDCGNASRLISSETSNSTNVINSIKYMGTAPTTLVTNNSGGVLAFSDKSRVNAYPSEQSIPNTGAALDLINEVEDLQGELSGGVYTSSAPRILSVTCSIRTGAATTGSLWTLDIIKNGTVAERAGAIATGGDFYLRVSVGGLRVNQGDTLSFFVNHNEAGSAAITSSSRYSATISES